MKRTTCLLILSAVLGLLVACEAAEQEPIVQEDYATVPSITGNQENLSPPIGDNSSYPAPSAGDVYPSLGTDFLPGDGSGYPSPLGTPLSAYPAPAPQFDESKRFTFVEPIIDGQSEISGRGVPEISIKVISVSNAGEVLGFGIVSGEGDFTITVNRPVHGGESLGIQFASDNIAKTLDDIPGTDMPLIGFLLAQTVVVR